MAKFIETTGRSEEDAIAAALFQLGLDRDDVSVEVLERAKTGFFGFGASPARVRVSYGFEEDVVKPEVKAEPKVEKKPEPKPAPKAEKKPEVKEEPVLLAKPRKEEPKQEVKAEPKAPETAPEVEEETILVAKTPYQHGEQRANSGRSRNRSRNRRKSDRLQDGDEVIIGKSEKQHRPDHVPVSQAPSVPVSEDDEKAQKIAQFLKGLMEHMGVESTPVIGITQEGNYKVIMEGENLGAIIGRRGETLDAIQQLTNYCVNRGASKRVRIHIDAEGYRAKREESLQHLALKVAGKVVKYRKNMTLEPMNAYERHVIHAALQDVAKVTTYSTGVEPNRRTVVVYAPDKQI